MAFDVPWRILIPLDALDRVFGGEAWPSAATQAEVRVSSEDEAPSSLSDKIVKVKGSTAQKEEAVRYMLSRLWKCQGIAPDEEGIFVLISPTCAVGAVIGTKGAKIKEIMESSGADINVGREAVIGMPDNPMVLNGSQEQVLVATVKINEVLQQLANQNKLKEDDFIYIPGRQNMTARPIPRGGPSGLSARLLVSKSAAGYLIGKAGQKVRELKEDSGAQLQFRNAEEEPSLTLSEDERVLEIRGGVQERDQGVRVVLAAMEQMIEPPRETCLLVPTSLDRSLIDNAAGSADLSLRWSSRPGNLELSEAVATLEGPMLARSRAIFAILPLIDTQSGGSALPSSSRISGHLESSTPKQPISPELESASPPALDSQRVSSGTMWDRASAMVAASSSTQAAAAEDEEEEEQRIEPETKKAFTWSEFKKEFSKVYSEKDVLDYWRDACTVVPKTERKKVAAEPPVAHVAERQPAHEDVPERIESPMRTDVDHTARQSQLVVDEPLHSASIAPTVTSSQLSQATPVAQTLVAEPDHNHAQQPEIPKPQPVVPMDARYQHHQPAAAPALIESPKPQPVAAIETRHQQHHQPGQMTSEPSKYVDPVSFTPFTQEQLPALGGAGDSMWGGGHCPQFASWNMSEMLAYAQCGFPNAQLQMLLPKSVVQGRLAPGGQLASVAQACGVQIDLDAAAAIPADQLRVVISGSCVGNSLAVLMLQWHILFAESR